MAEVEKAAQDVQPTGTTITRNSGLSAADTYLIPNDGKTVLEIVNKGAADTVVTIVTPGTQGGLPVEDQKVTVVKETGEKVIGPFPKSLYNNAKEQIEVKLSVVTTVTMAIYQVG